MYARIVLEIRFYYVPGVYSLNEIIQLFTALSALPGVSGDAYNHFTNILISEKDEIGSIYGGTLTEIDSVPIIPNKGRTDSEAFHFWITFICAGIFDFINNLNFCYPDMKRNHLGRF